MRHRGNAGLAIALAVVVMWQDPAFGHRPDLINGDKAGPIRIGQTTLATAESWFGPADAVRRVVVGCDVPLKLARWHGELVIFFARGADGGATETKVLRRTLLSEAHGEITVHTRRGLEIGDSRRKLRRLYPDARRFDYRDRDWYVLKSSPSYGRVEAAVEGRRVTILKNAPWEYC